MPQIRAIPKNRKLVDIICRKLAYCELKNICSSIITSMTKIMHMLKSKLYFIVIVSILPLLVNAQWTIDSLSLARVNLSASAAEDKLIFAGGFSFTPIGPTKRVDILDLNTGEWKIDSLPVEIDDVSSTSVDSLVFFAGTRGLSSSNVLNIYNAKSDQWTTREIPNAIYDKSLASANQKVIIGVAAGDIVDVYDIESDTWATLSLTEGKSDISIVSSKNKLFFAGGYHWENGMAVPNKIIEIYDISTGTWRIDSLHEARYDLSVVSHKDKVYFAGGNKKDGTSSNIIDIYDISTQSWTVDSLSVARSYLSSTAIGDYVIFAGGMNHNDSIFKTVDILNVENNSWTKEQLSIQRLSCTAVSANGKSYFAGGLTSRSTMTDIIEILELGVSSNHIPLESIQNLKVYPNPASEKTLIKFNRDVQGDIIIYSIDGKAVMRNSVNGVEKSLDVSNLDPGFYILRFENESLIGSTKFIVE